MSIQTYVLDPLIPIPNIDHFFWYPYLVSCIHIIIWYRWNNSMRTSKSLRNLPWGILMLSLEIVIEPNSQILSPQLNTFDSSPVLIIIFILVLFNSFIHSFHPSLFLSLILLCSIFSTSYLSAPLSRNSSIFFYCQAQPQSQVQLSWAEIALLSQLWGIPYTMHTAYPKNSRVHFLIAHGLSITCHDLFKTFFQHIYDLFMTYSQLLHNFF